MKVMPLRHIAQTITENWFNTGTILRILANGVQFTHNNVTNKLKSKFYYIS